MNDYTFELLTAIPENLLKYMKEKNVNDWMYLILINANGFHFQDVDDLKFGDIISNLNEKHKLLFIHKEND